MGTKESATERGQQLRFECYKQNNPDECQRLGQYLEIFRDFEKAGKVFKYNCDQNRYGKSCFQYAEYLMNGQGGVEKNEEEALTKFEQSCQLDYLPGCHNVGAVAAASPDKNFNNTDKGIEHLELACSKSFIPSCELLLEFYFHGYQNIKKDMSKAFKCAEKLCDLGSPRGCINLGVFYKNGDGGVEKDPEMTKKYFAKAKKLAEGSAEKNDCNC
ncbi:hypothetical protein LOTGIDRAFT_106114 [Lottia gigantea]|uniref:Beta-lactamase n=1 Tax=Lottia gigantea TaxID=225164 RepID=V4A1X5_LOTGI|nr:hypothetical protein LOTGIDRAFT_106114 [Lottia gigantea]ESO88905.1 hypothetical protein LOTGIDRAFT_106114 [Lottia gigantea]